MNIAEKFGTVLPTTVVGSYPVVSQRGLSSLFDPLRSAVHTAIGDQVAAGIDIISDGQVRGDMVQIFSRRLPGIRGLEVIGKVLPAEETITAADTRQALRTATRVKGIVTGPTTLAHALHLSTRVYRNKEELALDLAAALAREVRGLVESGVCIIQIDEPIFSTGIADLGNGREAIRLTREGVGVPVCLHACGGLSEIIDDLLAMPVDILDIECAKSPANLDLFSKTDLKGKGIGFGCVDSADPAIEDPERIADRIRKGIEAFGAETMLLDPDCGLRMQSRESAFGKLQNLVLAARTVRAEIGK